MPKLVVVNRKNEETVVEAGSDLTVMEAIRDSGFVELLALCGGCCSCATCHVYVDTAYMSTLPPMSADECDLLDGSSHRKPESRLACQLRFNEELDGLRVAIAPED